MRPAVTQQGIVSFSQSKEEFVEPHPNMAVTLHTTNGDIKLELYVQSCPKACEVRLPYFETLFALSLAPWRLFGP